MEKISYSANGQWKLEKAKPGPDASSYNFKESDSYTGKDLKDAHRNTMNMAIGKNIPMEMRDHAESGKKEPHILIHRGMESGDEKGENRYGGYDIKSKDGNMTHSTHAVHTTNPEVAAQFGNIHSFWVPVSSVEATSKYLNARQKDKTKYNQVEGGNWDVEGGAEDVQAIEDEHIVVKPGSYKHASREELEHHQNKEVERYNKVPKNDKSFRPIFTGNKYNIDGNTVEGTQKFLR